jgi:hypothetical protein
MSSTYGASLSHLAIWNISAGHASRFQIAGIALPCFYRNPCNAIERQLTYLSVNKSRSMI